MWSDSEIKYGSPEHDFLVAHLPKAGFFYKEPFRIQQITWNHMYSLPYRKQIEMIVTIQESLLGFDLTVASSLEYAAKDPAWTCLA